MFCHNQDTNVIIIITDARDIFFTVMRLEPEIFALVPCLERYKSVGRTCFKLVRYDFLDHNYNYNKYDKKRIFCKSIINNYKHIYKGINYYFLKMVINEYFF